MAKAILIVGAFILTLTGAAMSVFGGVGGSAAAQTADEALGETEDTGPYLLRPGDRVAVSVLEDPTLNREALILPDGRISLPIAGTLTAAGVTPERLASTISSRLRDIFVSPPTVTVSAIGIAQQSLLQEEIEPPTLVFVLGEVRNPGAFPFDTPLTVLQFLAIAGGPGPFAARDRIQIHHNAVQGEEEAYIEIFDYEALEEGLAPAPAPVLSDGDIIVVPERGLFD